MKVHWYLNPKLALRVRNPFRACFVQKEVLCEKKIMIWVNFGNVFNQKMMFSPKLYISHVHCILSIGRNLLENREDMKYLPHPFYHTNLDWFIRKWSKNSKWPIFQNVRFSKSPILKNFSRKFHRLVLGLVGLIDAKAISTYVRHKGKNR